MHLFRRTTKDILIKLIKEECEGTPVTYAEARRRWGRKLTWKNLIDIGFINRQPGGVTASKNGRKWYDNYRQKI